MRLRIYGDILLEFGPFSALSVPADVIFIAGDLANGTRGIDWDHFHDTPVVCVLGNHDLDYKCIPELTHAIRGRYAGTRIHLIENESVSIAGDRFLGCSRCGSPVSGSRQLGGLVPTVFSSAGDHAR